MVDGGANIQLRGCTFVSNNAMTLGGACRRAGAQQACGHMSVCVRLLLGSMHYDSFIQSGAVGINGVAHIESSVFSQNLCDVSGGAVGSRGSQAVVELTTSCVLGNQAGAGLGGGVSFEGRALIDRSAIGPNSEPWARLAGTTFLSNVTFSADAGLIHGLAVCGDAKVPELPRNTSAPNALAVDANTAVRASQFDGVMATHISPDRTYFICDGETVGVGATCAMQLAVCLSDIPCPIVAGNASGTTPVSDIPPYVSTSLAGTTDAWRACPDGVRRGFVPMASTFCVRDVCEAVVKRCSVDRLESGARQCL